MNKKPGANNEQKGNSPGGGLLRLHRLLFGKKTSQKLLEKAENQTLDQSYWGIVRRRFRQNKLALWSFRLLCFLLFLAVFADFLANDKPIFCKIEGKIYFPVMQQYAIDLGLSRWDSLILSKDWSEQKYESVLRTPIPYSATFQDGQNWNYKGPFNRQKVPSKRYWHWLGTDKLGRDVAAGLIKGTRTAMLVGVIAMSIASLIGIFLGSLAGYFGDNRFKVSRARLSLNLLGLFFALFYGFFVRNYALKEAAKAGNLGAEVFKSLAIFMGVLLIFNFLTFFLRKAPLFEKKITLPLDLLIMRLIEILNSIPALFLILSLVAILKNKSIIQIMVIIGLISWTGIARFIRAEMLRIRNLEYIQAARAMGFSETRIIFRHAIPNALTPVLISIAFGIAGAILLEAALSFLGIGVPLEEVTWGRLLAEARGYYPAWWLAIFPGMAIFVTVTIFNLIGEGLTEALDPKLKQ